MKKNAINLIALVIFTVFGVLTVVLAGTTLNGDITIPDVADYEATTTFDLTLKDGSIADSFSYSGGVFTVTNPDTTTGFNVSSSSSSVKSFILKSGSNNVLCTLNTTPGTSYINITNAAGEYTILPSSAVTDCGTLCTAVTGVATFNGYPSCVPSSCSTNYTLNSSNVCYIPGSSGGGGGGGIYTSPTDLIPPVISDVVFSNETLSFVTNESAKTKVLYGETAAYGETLENTVYKTGHSFTIPDLLAGVVYHFRIEAKDSTGNFGVKTGTFTIEGDIQETVVPVVAPVVTQPTMTTQLTIPSDLTTLSKRELLIIIIQLLLQQFQ